MTNAVIAAALSVLTIMFFGRCIKEAEDMEHPWWYGILAGAGLLIVSTVLFGFWHLLIS